MANTKTTTVTATATQAATPDFTKSFAVLKHWPKQAGEKVTNEQLAIAASMLKRHGTAKHLALAMYFRPQGATQIEVTIATGDTGNNVYGDAHKTLNPATKKPWAVEVPIEKRSDRKVYKLALPEKAASKATGKATGKRKQASKAKVTPAPETPATPAPEAGNSATN